MPHVLPQLSGLSSARKRWTVVILAMVMFTHTMDFMVIMPLGPRLMDLFHITPHQFSLLIAVYSFSAGVSGFLGSLLFDRLDRKHALVGAYLGFLIGTFSCGFAPSYTILLCSRAVAGAFGGLLSGISYAIVGDIFTVHERGSAMGKLMTSFSLAAIVGVPFGLVLARNFGWHYTFMAIVLLGLSALSLVLAIVPNVRTHIQAHYSGLFSGLTENLGDPNSRRALVTTLTMVLSQFVVIPFISTYLVTNTGYPESELPLLYLLGGSLTAFTGPLVGRICDAYSASRVFTKTGVLFLIPVFFITHLHITPSWLTLFISTSFFVLSNARMVPAMTMISSSIPPSRRGSFMSLNSCLQQLGSASASYVGGFVITQAIGSTELQGFNHSFYLSAFFGLCAYFFCRRIRTVS